ncbi:MFS transporter [Catenulispora subtropica]|uniref:NarK/NasA family nitrate transporter n=1 Tax=Catenulispora subtropica TaxID=450798 RepID=A0ABP5DVZ7_9ACTN
MTATAQRPAASGAEPASIPAAAWRNLAMATLGFTINFWAWNLIGPLGPTFGKDLHLSSAAQSLLVAVPVLVGALGRVPVGALTDKLGARTMFPLVSFLTIIPVLLLIPAKHSLPALLAVGFLLGLGGTTFAIGVPLVNSWFPAAKRGMAIGVFGMGMGGTALSAYSTPRLSKAHGLDFPFLLVAGLLAAYGLLALLLVGDRPGRPVPAEPLVRRLRAAGRLRVTWELSALYAVGFGGIVAFGVYLPTYLKNLYHLSQTDAGTKAAGFALLAVLFRPIGGWLSDRVAPALVAAGGFALVAVLAVVQAFDPALSPGATVSLLGIAAALGTTAGAVFALVAQASPQAQVGSVTGIVGAVGGLGGFVPPLVMGAVYGAKHSYSIGLMLLADLALAAMVYGVARMRVTRTAEG